MNSEIILQQIVNLTPHTVRLLDVAGDVVAEWGSSGEVRASTERVQVSSVTVAEDGGVVEVPVYEVRFGRVEGRPELVPDTYYIVSRIAAEAMRAAGSSTDDLLIPDDLVRGPDGQPVGCRGFARL